MYNINLVNSAAGIPASLYGVDSNILQKKYERPISPKIGIGVTPTAPAKRVAVSSPSLLFLLAFVILIFFKVGLKTY